MPQTDQTDYAGIKAAIYDWFKARSGLSRVMWLEQPAPRLQKPYATLQIISRGGAVGFASVYPEMDGDIIERTYVEEREMTVQFNVYTDPATQNSDLEATEYMDRALSTLSLQQVVDDFREAKVAALRWQNNHHNPYQVAEVWERHASVDVMFHYHTQLFDDGLDAPPDDGQSVGTAKVTVNSEPEQTVTE